MVSRAWTEVHPDTIIKCFRRSGILPASEHDAEEDHMVISPLDESAFRPAIEYENTLEIEVSLLFIW